MKNRLFRVLSLSLLLAVLAAGMLPGYAAAKPSIITSTQWAGAGRGAVLVNNLPSDATSFSITSSKKDVIRVGCDDKKDAGSLWLEPLKKGKSKITVKYKTGGKKKSVSTTFEVKAYPKPFDYIKINGKKINLTKNKLAYDCLNFKKTKLTIDFKIGNKDWKVNFLDGAKIKGDDFVDFKWKKGKAIKLAKDEGAFIDIRLINKKTGDEFLYLIFVSR